jgi:hypothetical protein
MIAVTLVAVLLGLANILGGFLGMMFLALIWCAVPTPLVICALFGRRDVQAFAIGALIPWLVFLGMDFPARFALLPATICILIVGGACGGLGMVTRRWLERVNKA